VPDGIEYEVVVREKNYKEQAQIVVATMTDVQKRLTFKLESTSQRRQEIPNEPCPEHCRTFRPFVSLCVCLRCPGFKKETQLRTVHGVVSDKSENPLPNSVVFLKNLRTNAVRSNLPIPMEITGSGGLDPNADYEVHAEFEGAKSPVRNVSSLDNRKEMVVNLKIDKKKS